IEGAHGLHTEQLEAEDAPHRTAECVDTCLSGAPQNAGVGAEPVALSCVRAALGMRQLDPDTTVAVRELRIDELREPEPVFHGIGVHGEWNQTTGVCATQDVQVTSQSPLRRLQTGP